MSVSNSNVIDAAAENGDELVLLISDHMTWALAQIEHLDLLQKKLNTYIRYIENGGWKNEFRGADFSSYKIEIGFKYIPHISFEKMIEAVRPKLDDKNITIEWHIEGGE